MDIVNAALFSFKSCLFFLLVFLVVKIFVDLVIRTNDAL